MRMPFRPRTACGSQRSCTRTGRKGVTVCPKFCAMAYAVPSVPKFFAAAPPAASTTASDEALPPAQTARRPWRTSSRSTRAPVITCTPRREHSRRMRSVTADACLPAGYTLPRASGKKMPPMLCKNATASCQEKCVRTRATLSASSEK